MALKVGPGMSENSDGLTGARGGPTHLAKGNLSKASAQNGDQGSANALRKTCSNSPHQVGHRVRLTEVALTDG